MTSATDKLRRLLDERGTLTAEQVREATESHSREYQSPTDAYVYLTENDWQAIADELNTTLGSEREKALKELVRDMWFYGYEGHMDSESQEWQMKHIDGVLDRMNQLGIEVD